jgi:hypothetical protein
VHIYSTYYISTDEDPGLRIESFAVINLHGVSTNKTIIYKRVFNDLRQRMDLLPNEHNFDLDKSRQKFHHGVKEHHKISNIPKFRCEML